MIKNWNKRVVNSVCVCVCILASVQAKYYIGYEHKTIQPNYNTPIVMVNMIGNKVWKC